MLLAIIVFLMVIPVGYLIGWFGAMIICESKAAKQLEYERAVAIRKYLEEATPKFDEEN